jgi:RNA polymerase sigma-70 factor (ECF subfamily)
MSALLSELPTMTQPATDLAALVRQHQADVWRYLRYLGAAASDADDLTQETFLAVARSEFIEQSPQQTAAYLRTVARNQLLMLRRRQGREINTVELATAEQVWSQQIDPLGTSGFLAALAECLEQLEGRVREAINGFYRDHLSREELAEKLEMKPDGIKTLLRRTREVLRNCIEKKL